MSSLRLLGKTEILDIDNISDLTSEKISDIVEIIIKTP